MPNICCFPAAAAMIEKCLWYEQIVPEDERNVMHEYVELTLRKWRTEPSAEGSGVGGGVSFLCCYYSYYHWILCATLMTETWSIKVPFLCLYCKESDEISRTAGCSSCYVTCLTLRELTAKTAWQSEHEADISTRSVNQLSLDVNILWMLIILTDDSFSNYCIKVVCFALCIFSLVIYLVLNHDWVLSTIWLKIWTFHLLFCSQ